MKPDLQIQDPSLGWNALLKPGKFITVHQVNRLLQTKTLSNSFDLQVFELTRTSTFRGSFSGSS